MIPNEIRPNHIAYFSMEVGLDSAMPTYSGGLGVLAGDTLRAAADLGLPMIGVTLLHRKGYFHQTLNANGNQTESPAEWDYEEMLEPMVPRAFVPIAGRAVMVRAWCYVVRGVFGHTVPVYFLDTALAENEPWEQSLTEALYDGDTRHRLCQEIVLGMGGVAMLQALGYKNVSTYHMNEGHAAFLTLALLEREFARGDRTERIIFSRPANGPAICAQFLPRRRTVIDLLCTEFALPMLRLGNGQRNPSSGHR